MLLKTTARNLNNVGIWFVNSSGNTMFPSLMMVGPFVPLLGQRCRVNAAGVISSRPDSSNNYPGFGQTSFTATQTFLWQKDPTVDFLYDWTGTPLGPNTAKDINGGLTNPSFCYANHNHSWVYDFVQADCDGSNRWVIFVGWAFSSPTPPSSAWLLWEPTECQLSAEIVQAS